MSAAHRPEGQSNQGMVYVFTGDGKGKTSAALGIMIRGLAVGWHVGWVSWYKNAEWRIAEHQLSTILVDEARSRLHMFAMGKGFYIPDGDQRESKTRPVNQQYVTDVHSQHEHCQAADQALQKARELLPTVELLVLDEVCNAISDNLVLLESVHKLLDVRKTTHCVLTGRDCPLAIRERADLVSEIRKQKHPYDAGKLAVRGLDF